MPFRTALSGLNAASSELRIIGHNVANSSTVGFKKSRAEFADVFASSALGVSSNAIGTGVRVAAVSQQFSQGNVGFTDNNLDLAINGQGFFIFNDNGISSYSRAGQLGVDREGYVVNTGGSRLTVFQADPAGNVTGGLGDLQLDTSDIAPNPTSLVDLALNLDSSAAIPGAATTTDITLGGTTLDTNDSPYTSPGFTLYDNDGLGVPASTLLFTYTGGGALWDVELRPGGAATVPPTIQTGVDIGTDTALLNWDPDGSGAQLNIPITIDTTGLTSQTVAAAASNTTASSTQTQGPFDATNANTYNSSTSLEVFDSLGASHLATTYYRKTDVPNQWQSYMFVDGTQVNGPEVLEFSPQGTIITPVAPSQVTVAPFNPGGGAANLGITLDYADTTQYGSGFSVNALVQDGFTTGRLSGIDVSTTGVITSRFTNGQSRTLGQVALANFANPQGLRQLGGTTWSESFDSGAALVSAAGSGSLGVIQSGALEGSNVDLTEQLVGMITAQRNFQANAQVITTADTITQTIINIR
ncbi:flagellar hook protein FlgE [Sulfuriflexus mobilis]|uniref:flagellar hook protein FlgE n=1 Tax=Sulfuriflexus mobilis TaxID=1811807 RepID=UPI000F8396AD|nr:flagellar hook protein FlgE [Sulfuriflexus mobilis]